MRQRISLIWAMGRNRVIGKDNWLPWNLPDELEFFRSATACKPVIMGRRTYQSVNRPMPGRLNIVLSRSGFEAPGVVAAADMEAAFARARQDPADECFVIGGAEPYRHALPVADRLYATFVDASPDGDTFFPPILPALCGTDDFPPRDLPGWRVVESAHHGVDARHAHAYDIRVYEREDAGSQRAGR